MRCLCLHALRTRARAPGTPPTTASSLKQTHRAEAAGYYITPHLWLSSSWASEGSHRACLLRSGEASVFSVLVATSRDESRLFVHAFTGRRVWRQQRKHVGVAVVCVEFEPLLNSSKPRHTNAALNRRRACIVLVNPSRNTTQQPTINPTMQLANALCSLLTRRWVVQSPSSATLFVATNLPTRLQATYSSGAGSNDAIPPSNLPSASCLCGGVSLHFAPPPLLTRQHTLTRHRDAHCRWCDQLRGECC